MDDFVPESRSALARVVMFTRLVSARFDRLACRWIVVARLQIGAGKQKAVAADKNSHAVTWRLF